VFIWNKSIRHQTLAPALVIQRERTPFDTYPEFAIVAQYFAQQPTCIRTNKTQSIAPRDGQIQAAQEQHTQIFDEPLRQSADTYVQLGNVASPAPAPTAA